MQLVDEIRREKLPREVGAADDHHIAILRRGFGQSHGRLDSIGHECERDASVLLRMMSRRAMGDDEDGHLELVVVGQRVGVAIWNVWRPINTAPVSAIRSFMYGLSCRSARSGYRRSTPPCSSATKPSIDVV